MGAGLFKREAAPQTAVSRSNNPYRYPPPDGGNYFSSHYHLGFRKFETADPEAFLFGELNDLNFLGSRPVNFPYKQPPKSQPIKCLRSCVNLQRDSVKLVKLEGSEDRYHIEFMFDSDVDCIFTIYNFLPDVVELESLRNDPHLSVGVRVSRPFHYSQGMEQQFVERSYSLAPGEMEEERLSYNPEEGRDTFPVAILMESNGMEDNQYQSQLTICNLDRFGENGFTIKVIKQKFWVDGVEYLLQEIYGAENKTKRREEGEEEEGENEEDEEEEDLGAECAICITDIKDTMLLPCRHLCLCSGCAANLRYQSNNCPICRAPFQALLQIQALEPLDPDEIIDEDEATGDPKYAMPGYRMLPLLQALNGYSLDHITAGEVANDDNSEEQEEVAESPDPECIPQMTTQFCVIRIDDEEDGIEVLPESELVLDAPPTQKRNAPQGKRYETDEEFIPLPGTPVSDTSSSRLKQSNSGSPNSTVVRISIIDDEEEERRVNMEDSGVSHDSEEPDSPRASSLSSEHSAQSTEMLLPAQLSANAWKQRSSLGSKGD